VVLLLLPKELLALLVSGANLARSLNKEMNGGDEIS